MRIELTTYALRVRCSTPELPGRVSNCFSLLARVRPTSERGTEKECLQIRLIRSLSDQVNQLIEAVRNSPSSLWQDYELILICLTSVTRHSKILIESLFA